MKAEIEDRGSQVDFVISDDAGEVLSRVALTAGVPFRASMATALADAMNAAFAHIENQPVTTKRDNLKKRQERFAREEQAAKDRVEAAAAERKKVEKELATLG